VSELHEIARPGLMLSQVWPQSRESEGETLRAMQTAVESGRFAAFQTVEIPFPAERREMARLLQGNDFRYTYCLTRVLNENGIDLSAIDNTHRRESLRAIIPHLDHAREAGADSVSLISGSCPGSESDRRHALVALADSMRELVKAALEPPALNILLEPLDVASHKNRALGHTREAVAICAELADDDLPLFISLDTAHIILNNEDPVEALQMALEYTADFHYCNCVTDREHPLYGDNHIPFGPPGVLDLAEISAIMKHQSALTYFGARRRPVVMCEVFNSEGNSYEMMHYCIDTMESAWRSVVLHDERDRAAEETRS